MTTMTTLDYFFDFLSPYSYFSWHLIQDLQKKCDINIRYYPVVLGKILSHWGIKGPAEVLPKRNYLFRHCLRWAAKEGINFNTPEQLPFNSLYALRLAILENGQERQVKIIETLWHWGWQKGKNLGDPDQLVVALNEAGLPGEELLERTFDGKVRRAMKSNIEKAIDYGVFGVPSFIVEEQLFWGIESFPDLKLYIGGQDPLDPQIYQEFLNKMPS